MRQQDRRLFEDPTRLKEMLDFYASGEGLSSLARKYNCDHTSILYRVRKHGVYVANRRPVRKRIAAPSIPKQPPVPLWSRFANQYRCCGSKIPRRHLESCKHFVARSVPVDFTKPIDSREVRNVGKTYAQYIKDMQIQKMRRFRCFSKASIHGVPIILPKKEEDESDTCLRTLS